MESNPMAAWAFGATLFSLAVFQTLFLVVAPEQTRVVLMVLCVGIDAGLGVVFFRGEVRRKRLNAQRFNQVQDTLQQILTLTRSQQAHWLDIMEGVVNLESEDKETMDSLQHLLRAMTAMMKEPIETRSGEPLLAVESMIDAIQTMLLLNHNLMADFDSVMAFYHQTYERLRTVRSQVKLNHFRLRESVDFLEQMSKETNRYSERLILDVLDRFKEITVFSQGIGTEVISKMRRLMDPGNAESLDAVNRESAAIQKTMDGFFSEMGQVNEFTEKSIRDNVGQMERIKTMAQDIADFAENIRMISLNLNIEAARSTYQGSQRNGKAFQVLATRLSELAVKAGELARQQQDVLDTASTVMTQSGDVQRQRLSSLMGQIQPIKGRLEPFTRIVHHTFSQFAEVENAMERLSSSIENKLQAVIGKFQFQDLVRQEQQHILAMFLYIRDRSEQGMGSLGVLDEVQKREAWTELIRTFEDLATTENELAIIRDYRKKNPALSKDTDRSDLTAGSVEMF